MFDRKGHKKIEYADDVICHLSGAGPEHPKFFD